MRIAIRRLCDESRELIHKIRELDGYEPDCIVERRVDLFGTTCDGIDVVSTYEARKRYESGRIDKLLLPAVTEFEQRIEYYTAEAGALGFKEEDILYDTCIFFMGGNTEEPFVRHDRLRYLDYLEFHTNDHCNLNCNNCNNFSNYVKGEVFNDYERIKKDLSRIREIVDHIRRIRILGGEPLLNPELPRFIRLARELYPYSELVIVTNGILLQSKMKDELEVTVKECDAYIDITAYPVMFDKIDSLIDFLRNKGIKVKQTWEANFFRKPIMDEFGYPLSRVDCMCIHLRDGKLARCPIVQYLDYYNEANGTNYDGSDGVIDLYEEGLTFKELNERLHKPFKLCNRCGFWRDDLIGEPWSRGSQ